MGPQADLNYVGVFDAMLIPSVLLSTDLVIRDANRAYLEVTGREREELIGKCLLDAFPDNPSEGQDDAVGRLRASLKRALESGQPDMLPVQRYDIPVWGTDRFTQRYWSSLTIPIRDDAGKVTLLLHRTEDVTDYVLERDRRQLEHQRGQDWRERMEEAETRLLAHANELQLLNRQLQEAAERERRVALTLQQALLPSSPSVLPGLSVATRYQPAENSLHIGGDWYDVIDLGGGCVTVAVGDVVGKGLTAAAVMGELRSALTAATYGVESPVPALDVLDRYARSLDGALGTTVVQARLDLAAHELCYSRAGHLPPLIVPPDGPARFLTDALAPPLAVQDTVQPRPQAEAPFPPGAMVVLYTDGLVERRGRDLDVGLLALADTANRTAALDVETVADTLLSELLEDAAAPDDIALVVARATG